MHAPTLARSRVRVTRHASPLGSWELARARPAGELLPYVRDYVGWVEHLPAPVLRRELPTDEAPLIINFGAPFRLVRPGRLQGATTFTSFITGAYHTFQLVESCGDTSGVQANFTLLGLRLFVGRPIEDMTNRALAPEDVLGPFARDMTDRLYNASSWEDRFSYLDQVLLVKLRCVDGPPAGVRSAWRQLLASGGRARVAAIRGHVDWSERHFIARFRHELGVTPKILARMLRFTRFVRAIRNAEVVTLADSAHRCGYYDQSHLSRDAREFAGTTPGELLKSLLPDEGGFGAK